MAAVHMPPRGLDLVEDRTSETMESIRADMSLQLLESTIVEATLSSRGDSTSCEKPGEGNCPWPTYSMTDANGVVHVCAVQEELSASSSIQEASSSYSDGGKKRVVDVSEALDQLNGKCAMLHHEYWSYIWCHRGTIMQTHSRREDDTINIKLGQYVRTEVKRARSIADVREFPKDDVTPERVHSSAEGAKLDEMDGTLLARALHRKVKEVQEKMQRTKQALDDPIGSLDDAASGDDNPPEGIDEPSTIVAVDDFYENGDMCEETRESRKVRTSIICCTNALVGANAASTAPLAILISVKEVSTCNYLVQVCSRLLCPSLADGADETGVDTLHGSSWHGSSSLVNAAVRKGAPSSSAFDVLDALEPCFPARKEAWWTYELCFTSGIKQYHSDWRKTSNGNIINVVSTEYSLGKFDRSSVKSTGEELLRPGAEDGEGSVVLEFTGGSECDLTGVLRSATVFLKCGPMDEITEVMEDFTCHYRVVAVSPLLCRHPALMPKMAASRVVTCVKDRSKNKTNGYSLSTY